MQAYPKMDPNTSQTNAQHSVISSPSKSTSNSLYQYNMPQDQNPHRYVPHGYNMGLLGQYRDSPYSRVPLPNDFNRTSNSNSIIISGNNVPSTMSTNAGDKHKFYPKVKQSSESMHPKQQQQQQQQKCVVMTHHGDNLSRQSPPDPGGDQQEHAYKKMRLSEPSKSVTHDQTSSVPFVPTLKFLNVDVKDSKPSNEVYNPQVEAISPTMPNDVVADTRTVKDDLIMQISKVDSDIALAEKSRSAIFGKIQVLSESTNRPQIINKLNFEYREQQNLVRKIYEENRQKAATQHSLINSICQSSHLPIYNQPADLSVCERISSQYHATFKCRLVVYLKKIKMERSMRNNNMSEEYRKLTNDWNKKVEKIESNAKRKSRELKNREFFEKVFVELRKQREEKERFNRVGSRVKSEADLEEIMDGLQEQALEDKKMRSYAVIPPLMLDKTQKRVLYQNENGIILDMVKEYQDKQKLNLWTSGEKEIFKEKYLQHPKNFGVIAACLDRKSVQDCIRHYYLNKKFENFKQLLRKSRSSRTRSSRNPQKTQQSQTQCIIDSLTTGVTTRLQREQQQKQTVKIPNFAVSLNNSEPQPSTSSAATVASSTTTASASTVATCNKSNSNNTETPTKLPVEPAKPDSESSKISSECKTQTEQKSLESESSLQTEVKKEEVTVTSSNVTTETVTPVTTTTTTSVEIVESNSKPVETEPFSAAQKIPKFLEETWGVPSAITTETDNQQTCFVCKNQNCVRTRRLKKSKCHWYGISEDSLTEGARVCNACESKSVRNRFKNCPVPFCMYFKDKNTRKLYNIMPRLSHLNEEDKNNIFKELNFPTTVTKCCNKCYTLVLKKLKIDDFEIKKESLDSDYSNSTCDDEDDFEADNNAENKSIISQHSVINVTKAGSDDKKLQPPILQPRKKQKHVEEYDSSATETADEESEISPINRQSPKINKPQAPSQSLNVRDFVFDYIERSLKTTPSNQKPLNRGGSGNSGGQQQQQQPSYMMRDNFPGSESGDSSLKQHIVPQQPDGLNHKDVNVDLKNGSSVQQSKKQMPLYEYPSQPKAEVNESETLDLSLRKLSRDGNPAARTSPSTAKISSVPTTQYRNCTPTQQQQQQQHQQQQHMYLSYSLQDSHNMAQMPSSISLISSRQSQQRNAVSPHQQNHNKQQQQQQQQQSLQKSPKQQQQQQPQQQPIASPNFGKGSITHGTPYILSNSQSPYMQPSYSKHDNNKTGSITQGTPLPSANQFDMGKNSSRIHSSSPQSSLQASNKYTKQSYVNHPYPYTNAQTKQLTTRELVMQDFMTSQQMQKKYMKSDIEDQQKSSNIQYYDSKDKPEHVNRHVSPPQRQGVIQRHQKPSSPSFGSDMQHPYTLSGHDAFTSLVEVAAQQPQLPVPAKELIHESNDMKYMALVRDNNMMSSKFRSAINSEMAPNDLSRHIIEHRTEKDDQMKMFANHSSYQNNPKNPAQCEKDTFNRIKQVNEGGLSAKNLIDAIITQSINKGSNEPSMSKYYSMRENPTNSATENANRDQKSSGSSEMQPVYKSITIGELTNSIITRDFEANSGNVRQLIGPYPGDWKPQQQPQPPQQRRPTMKIYEGPNDKSSDNMHISNQNLKYNCDISSVNFYNQPQPSSMNGLNISGVKSIDRNSIQIPSVMSTNKCAQQFQNMERYVKNKIVEAMRTEDARHDESQFERNDKSQEVPEKRKDSLIKRHEDFQQYSKPITPTFAGQYYPYNALNVQSQNTSDIIPTSTSAIPSSSIEPKPLLQAKYDALSDED